MSTESVEWLEDYARAVIYSQTEYATACRPLDDLRALLDAATDLRNSLHADVMCATDVAELEHAEKLAMRMMTVVAIRQQSPARVAAATEMRARAFTLFSRAYDQVRRTVTFLRWDEDDADAFAPSLYAGRGGRGKPAEAKPRAGKPTEVPAETPGLPAKPAKAASNQPFLED